MTNLARVETISAQLRQSITGAFNLAINIEEGAGHSPDWLALCGQWGVRVVNAEERAEIQKAQKPTRGAPVMELGGVIEAIVKWARIETKRIDVWDDTPDTKIAHERLRRLVDRIADELVATYTKAVLPARKGMFGNALAHHDPNAKPSWDKTKAHTLRCAQCGAPRLKADDLMCPFCDQSMV